MKAVFKKIGFQSQISHLCQKHDLWTAKEAQTHLREDQCVWGTKVHFSRKIATQKFKGESDTVKLSTITIIHEDFHQN